MEISEGETPLKICKEIVLRYPECEHALRLWLNSRKAMEEMASLNVEIRKHAATNNE